MNDRIYSEGGLMNDGVTPSTDYPSIYRWRSSDGSRNRNRNRNRHMDGNRDRGKDREGDNRSDHRDNDDNDNDNDDDMIVSHTYQSQSNLLANLIQYRCKATNEE